MCSLQRNMYWMALCTLIYIRPWQHVLVMHAKFGRRQTEKQVSVHRYPGHVWLHVISIVLGPALSVSRLELLGRHHRLAVAGGISSLSSSSRRLHIPSPSLSSATCPSASFISVVDPRCWSHASPPSSSRPAGWPTSLMQSVTIEPS